MRIEVSYKKHENFLCWDLENRPSAYWYNGECTSEITAFGWRWNKQGPVQVWLLNRSGDYESRRKDGRRIIQSPALMFEHFADELRRADVAYGHNIRRHDLPMLNAGLMREQLPPLKGIKNQDTCSDFPKINGMSKSLESLCEYYGIEGEKLHMGIVRWEKSNKLFDHGVLMASKRVSTDVELQEKLRDHMEGLGLLKPARVWSA